METTPSASTTDLTPKPPPKGLITPVDALPAIEKANSRAWKGICWHHSAGADGNTRDWPGIVKYHTSYRIDFNTVTKEEFERRKAAGEGKHFELPWKDVGYHGGIEMVEGAAVYSAGRPLSSIGAHAGVAGASNRFNEEYIGLCAIGDFDKATPPPAIWEKALSVSRMFMEAFQIPASHVLGHREVYDKLGVPRQKSCPGKHWNMEMFREDLGRPAAAPKGHACMVVIKKNGTMAAFNLMDIERVVFS